MAVNNKVIFNGALNAYFEAVGSGLQPPPHDSATLAAATAFATSVDAAIPHSELMAAKDGRLAQSICAGVVAGRFPLDAVSADYDTLAAQIATAWTAAESLLA